MSDSLPDRVFRTLFSDDEWSKHIAHQEEHGRQVLECQAMTDAELAEKAERYLGQIRPPDFPKGSAVYDVVMHHVIIPEMIKRLKICGTETLDNK